MFHISYFVEVESTTGVASVVAGVLTAVLAVSATTATSGS
ncbi:hypothetical protein RA0C_0499 [Riemerella anatipestifer ATCC 11845 = DSM 15868]|uniref:Uncharacterized protein n=1 Tax=Riemerella anatipestifer (strain ATCC 11845 / DSM 15868 / JCM 9532 / NCTC 11014) TaxID=693978 RepID=H8MDC8_RIEAD|nr:hypothetical protein RA0C_0499 [Riemerella anatipestifer ATCC 11845 = DSM 15868]